MDNNKRERISQTDAKQRLGELVKRVAYGGQRIVLEFRGKPQAALVSMDDLELIESGAATFRAAEPIATYEIGGQRSRLEEIKRLPEPDRTRRILHELRIIGDTAAARSGIKSNVAREIEEMREERANELADLS